MSADGDLIRPNDLITPDKAAQILRNRTWTRGNGFIYTKTDCQCFEHPAIADIARALERIGIYAWSGDIDRENDLTISIKNEYVGPLLALGITPQRLGISGVVSLQQNTPANSAHAR